jgi:hypothetical protein
MDTATSNEFDQNGMETYCKQLGQLMEHLYQIYEAAKYTDSAWATSFSGALEAKRNVCDQRAFVKFEFNVWRHLSHFQARINKIDNVTSIMSGAREVFERHDSQIHFTQNTMFRVAFMACVAGMMRELLDNKTYHAFYASCIMGVYMGTPIVVTVSGTHPDPASLSARSASQLHSSFRPPGPSRMRRQTFGTQPGPWNTGE